MIAALISGDLSTANAAALAAPVRSVFIGSTLSRAPNASDALFRARAVKSRIAISHPIASRQQRAGICEEGLPYPALISA
jgi:hypothetical protein